MKKVLIVALFALAVVVSNLAVAEVVTSDLTPPSEPQHEISLGVSPLVGYMGKATGGDAYTDLKGNLFMSAAVSYGFSVFKYLQLGVNTSFSYLYRSGDDSSSNSSSASFLQLLGGPTLNIPFGDDWLYNSLFVTAMAGIIHLNGIQSSTEAALSGEIGYRIRLAEHVTFRPSVGVFKVLDGSDCWFIARPFSFSFVF